MSSRKVSALIVDDDVRMLRLMQRILELEGYRVRTASDARTALNTFDEDSPDLVLLDIMLPDANGFSVCHTIREFSQVPIIMVTAKTASEDLVEGLNTGADDYLTKPFAANELAARVKAVLRRSRLWDERPQPTFCSNNLTIDFAHHRVTLSGQEVNLTATEYRILSYLARNADRIVTPDQILQTVWDSEYMGETHLLQVNIARLRHKLKDSPRHPEYIVTRPGIGYMMKRDPRPGQ